MSVHTRYELRILARIGGREVCSTTSYDELERERAELDYRREYERARRIVGTEQAWATDQGGEIAGTVERVLVELVAQKTDGATFVTGPRICDAGTDREWSALVTSGPAGSSDARGAMASALERVGSGA